MGSVGTPVVRRMIDVADERHDRDELLESVGLSSDPAGVDWAGDSIDEEIYYGLLERIAGTDDPGFPFRYARALHPDDLGALGLAVKTAPTLRAALERLARYVLVLSDTLATSSSTNPMGRRSCSSDAHTTVEARRSPTSALSRPSPRCCRSSAGSG
jgi:hypothetical protein